MILADTSVWVDYFRHRPPRFHQYLRDREIMTHPLVVGELACGALKSRPAVLAKLQALPIAHCAEHREAMSLVEQHRLFGKGLGWVDVHLLASARLSKCQLWTLDTALNSAAARLDVAYSYSN